MKSTADLFFWFWGFFLLILIRLTVDIFIDPDPFNILQLCYPCEPTTCHDQSNKNIYKFLPIFICPGLKGGALLLL